MKLLNFFKRKKKEDDPFSEIEILKNRVRFEMEINKELRVLLGEEQQRYNDLFDEYGKETVKLRKYEVADLKAVRRSMDLNFLEAEYDKPVLWLQSDNLSLNCGNFANIRDKLKRLCPKIDLVIMTDYGVTLTELSDEDLNRVGLARIVGKSTQKLVGNGK